MAKKPVEMAYTPIFSVWARKRILPIDVFQLKPGRLMSWYTILL